MNARNKDHEGDRQCAYAIHINNNTKRKESQSHICEVLAKSCWRAGPGQEALDGSKVRRERKVGPFIPCEVRAQMGAAQATAPAVAQASSGDHRSRRLGESLSARVTTSTPGQELLHSGGNVCT